LRFDQAAWDRGFSPVKGGLEKTGPRWVSRVFAFQNAGAIANCARPTAVMRDKDGKELGTVNLTDAPSGVLMRVDLTGLSACCPCAPGSSVRVVATR
jgi:hypothetical protein